MSSTNFHHGVRTRQIATAVIPSRKTYSALPVVFGTAPIHRLSAEMRERVEPGKIAMIFSLTEAGQQLGIDVQRDDFDVWTLSEIAYSEFMLYNVSPCVFVNLFDPSKHVKKVTKETVSLLAGEGQLARTDIVGDVILTPVGGGDPYVAGTDYVLTPVTGQITVLDGGALALVSQVSAAYSYAAPELVTSSECIGGWDVVTNKITGISLIDDVFPRYRNVPTIALAPKFGEDPVVATVLAAKMSSINGLFQGVALCDLPSDGDNAITVYSDLPEYKQKKGLVSEDLYLTWPKVMVGDRKMRMSTLTASLIASVDADNGDIPYASPSNKNLPITAAVVGDEEIYLDYERANYLNANGIATALNHQDGWKLWGNRTACYPDITDVKDNFITGRRMFAWYGNRLVLTYWQKVDFPMSIRVVTTIVNSEKIYINSLTAGGYIYGGRIEFLEEENSVLDLIDGKITFHVYLGIIAPAESINFNLEFDTSYVSEFFAQVNAAVA